MPVEAYLVGQERGALDDVFDFFRNMFCYDKVAPYYKLVVPHKFVLGDFIAKKE